MKVIQELRVCSDCLQAIANGLDSLEGVETPERLAEIESGMAKLRPFLAVTSDEFGFSRSDCDCCGSELYGDRYGAAVLGPEEAQPEPQGKRLVDLIARALDAMRNCGERYGNAEWQKRHLGQLRALVSEHMPSGSGFDNGTELELEDSRPDRLCFKTSFHHMDNLGSYSGWTEHRVIVAPSFVYEMELKVTGRDRNGIKDYIAQAFEAALSALTAEPGSTD